MNRFSPKHNKKREERRVQTLGARPPPSCPEGRGLDFCQTPQNAAPGSPKTTSSPRFAALSLIASMRPGLPRAPPR